MLSISGGLLEYIQSNTRKEGQYVRVEVTQKDGSVIVFNDEDFNSGGISISRKSSSGSSLDVGECYINEAKFSVLDTQNKVTNSLSNATVRIYWGVNNTELVLDEELLLGTFTVTPDTTIRKLISVMVSCDSMLCKLDVNLNDVTIQGTLYDLVLWCCNQTGVELGMTQADFNALSLNTAYTYYVDAESSLKTYRDVIMYASQLIGGFATDTNEGKLVFKKYKTTNSRLEINPDQLASSAVGDSAFSLDALCMVLDKTTVYASGSVTSEYVLELDTNPLLDKLTEDVRLLILKNIWEDIKLCSFHKFNYTMLGNPAVECGDIIDCDVKGVSSYLTSFVWKYHGKSTFSGLGLDRRVKSTSQAVKKAASSGGGGSTSNQIGVLKFINASNIVIKNTKASILTLYINLPANTAPLFTFTASVKAVSNALLTLSLNYDNVDQLLFPKQTVREGYNLVSFSCSFDKRETAMVHALKIYATSNGVDNLTIAPYDLECNITAWGAGSGEPEWTGRYEITDVTSSIVVGKDAPIVLFSPIDGDAGITII